MNINRAELFKLYMEEINKIADLCEDKSYFVPEEIVDIICDLLEKNNHLINE